MSLDAPPLRKRAGWSPLRIAVSVLAVVIVFAAVGCAAGVVWFHLWTPPSGVASRGQWFPNSETSLGRMFGGTGLFVLVSLVGGLVLGLLTGLVLRRSELWVLAAVVVGSALAAWLTHLVGTRLGPPDPAVVAASAADGTLIPDDLTTPGHSFYAAWPAAALLGLSVAYLLGRIPGPSEPPNPYQEAVGSGTTPL